MVTYIANAFSTNMLSTFPATVRFQQITRDEFCSAVNNSNSVNAIGHAGTVQLINQLCNSNLNVNRISIRANAGDQIYIISLSVRLDEGRILSLDELQQLLQQNRITFILATVQ